jgi:restriction endonuclease
MQSVGYFDALSDLDFEELVADLITVVTGLTFRAGARGADGGIDVLAQGSDGEHVVQCKHFQDSTYSQLKSDAKREAQKLRARGATFASYRS